MDVPRSTIDCYIIRLVMLGAKLSIFQDKHPVLTRVDRGSINMTTQIATLHLVSYRQLHALSFYNTPIATLLLFNDNAVTVIHIY